MEKKEFEKYINETWLSKNRKKKIIDIFYLVLEKECDDAYDKGFKDGNQRDIDLTGSLIEVL